jgi:hypothetical protein
VNVDLTAGYAPDVFAARDPGVGSTGSVALGGQRATLQASVSRETRFFTALAYVAFGYDGRRDIGQPGGFEVLHIDAHPGFEVGVQTETRLAPRLALNLGVSAQKSMSYGEQYLSSFGNSFYTFKPTGTVSPYVGVVVPLLDNRMAAELLYQHDFIGNEKLEDAYGDTAQYYHSEDNLLLARLRFVFGIM